ncbi:Radical SAM domain-containing protein [Candidatus Desulfarcum epimagneticum]|uniref:Radical SAM domain-containing protein n=1 Tax=uncultured Desulfobacteraceae bacterium TaxID=218296 RepID=A0A484HF74_9BACT|nr:Radical SAM domain-containing protein [uncultured Desulfobacteraceae bacterium]
MSSKTMDCVIVGYNEPDLQDIIANWEKAKHGSGTFFDAMDGVIKLHNKWISYADFLDAVLYAVDRKKRDINIMSLPNLGLCYLKSFLNEKKLKIEIINSYNQEKKNLESILQTGSRAVAISSTFYSEPDPIKEIVKFIRRLDSETKIIVGGPYILRICNVEDILYQNYILSYIDADIYIHDAQGELTLSRLLHELRKGEKGDIDSIPNLIYLKNKTGNILGKRGTSRFKRTPREIESNDINENIINWDLFSKKFYTPTTQIRTSIGCSFKCAFCSFHKMAEQFMLASVKSIEIEMKRLHKAGVKNIIFVDDTLNVPHSRFKKILKTMIANKFDFNWFSFFRCADADEETFELMKTSGCKSVLLGIESADPHILKNMNKKASVDKLRYGIKRLKELDIETIASFIIGFPGETEKTAESAFEFIRETKPDFYSLNLFCYFHNTPIHKKASEFGLQGAFYAWCHNTMDWRKAAELIKVGYNSITDSIILPARFNMWGIANLFGLGVPMAQIKEFMKLTHPILVKNHELSSVTSIEKTSSWESLLAAGQKIADSLN